MSCESQFFPAFLGLASGCRLGSLSLAATPPCGSALRVSRPVLLLLLFEVQDRTQGLKRVPQALLCPAHFLELGSLCLAQAGQRLGPPASVYSALVFQLCSTAPRPLACSAVSDVILMGFGK